MKPTMDNSLSTTINVKVLLMLLCLNMSDALTENVSISPVSYVIEDGSFNVTCITVDVTKRIVFKVNSFQYSCQPFVGCYSSTGITMNQTSIHTTIWVDHANIPRDEGNWTCEYDGGYVGSKTLNIVVAGTSLTFRSTGGIVNDTKVISATTSCTYPLSDTNCNWYLLTMDGISQFTCDSNSQSRDNSSCLSPKSQITCSCVFDGNNRPGATGKFALKIFNGFINIERNDTESFIFPTGGGRGGMDSNTNLENVGAIAGGIAGGLVVVTIGGAVAVYCMQRIKRGKQDNGESTRQGENPKPTEEDNCDSLRDDKK